ncbi:hypothetical protein M3I53_09815 [Paraburkholderia sp. CNPSo 3272]|uniref:hypothetical protein n=1 Tax=Paraburkholderia sp. CNPSo 3272 TaxID=2940931 RepID=UPI0020B76880|nr:hypothetical protein [Paraburkholderia sp. CNPSo 3272]MCP3723427.1 hypothetical protein [Paraburkholderia sp. CNPSo 3272]
MTKPGTCSPVRKFRLSGLTTTLAAIVIFVCAASLLLLAAAVGVREGDKSIRKHEGLIAQGPAA